MAAGCTVPKATKIPLIVSGNSIAEMRGTHSVLQKRKLASLICRKAGYRKQTPPITSACARRLPVFAANTGGRGQLFSTGRRKTWCLHRTFDLSGRQLSGNLVW
jgi:hypothetical protein